MVEYYEGPSTTAKEAPKYYTFYIGFKGPKGGARDLKFRLRLVQKSGDRKLVPHIYKTLSQAKEARARMVTGGAVARILQWNTPATSTPHAHVAGKTQGYLLYSIRPYEIFGDKKTRGLTPGPSFWEG